MKKQLVAAAAVAFLTTPALAEEKVASPIDNMNISTFGQVRAYAAVDSRDGVDAEVRSDTTRFGFKANGQAGTVGLFGELSANVNANDANALTTRFGYVGVSLPKLGSVGLGRQHSVQDGFTDAADIFMSAGNNSVQQMGFYQNNSIKYTNEIGGIKIGALAAMADGDAGDETIDRYEVGVGAYGFAISMGQDEGADTSYYGIGYGATYGKITVGASYTIADVNDGGSFEDIVMFDSDKTTAVTRGIELAAGFAMSDKITINGGYNVTDADGDEGHALGEVVYSLGSNAVAFANVDYDIDASEYVTQAGLNIKF